VHYLDRNRVVKPPCLANLQEGWAYSDLRGNEKAEIRDALLELQGHRCAYCERRTSDEYDDGHIEHFRQQSDQRHLTVEWTNMFWSCNDKKSCGKHKDACNEKKGSRNYNHDEIIDPGLEDPEKWLLVVYDGTVTPRTDLNAHDQRRADETIRVFHLKAALLVRSREDAVLPYRKILEMLMEFSPDLRHQYITAELERACNTPFGTAIKHYLTSVSL
jgi:uncharacterized protein (TIGR02646 family)